MVVRKTKTDRRDALHILDLLRHDLPHDLGAGSRDARSARAPHPPDAPRPHPHHGQEWPARHRSQLPPRPWLQAAPPGRSGGAASSRAPPAHHAASRSQPPVARRAQRADPGARRRDHDGGPGPPRCPTPDHPPRRRGPDRAGHHRRVGARGPLPRQQARGQLRRPGPRPECLRR
jgi:hypothetical protein